MTTLGRTLINGPSAIHIANGPLRIVRSANGIDQQTLAHKLGISQSTIQNWETIRIPDKWLSKLETECGFFNLGEAHEKWYANSPYVAARRGTLAQRENFVAFIAERQSLRDTMRRERWLKYNLADFRHLADPEQDAVEQWLRIHYREIADLPAGQGFDWLMYHALPILGSRNEWETARRGMAETGGLYYSLVQQRGEVFSLEDYVIDKIDKERMACGDEE
jgi:transcriptional regulator with XRE-family HTH domain